MSPSMRGVVLPGGSRVDLPEELQMECWKGYKRGALDVMGRLSWDRPSVTLRTEFTKPVPDRKRFSPMTKCRIQLRH